MIGPGAAARQERQRAPRLKVSREHDFLEKVGVHETRTGEGHEESAGRDELHRQPVDILVAARRTLEIRLLLGKRGGITDHDVPDLALPDPPPEVLEDVFANEVGVSEWQAIR